MATTSRIYRVAGDTERCRWKDGEEEGEKEEEEEGSKGKKWLGGLDRSQQGKLQPTVTAGMARSKGEIALRWISGRRQFDVGRESGLPHHREEGVPCRSLLSPPLSRDLTLLGFAWRAHRATRERGSTEFPTERASGPCLSPEIKGRRDIPSIYLYVTEVRLLSRILSQVSASIFESPTV